MTVQSKKRKYKLVPQKELQGGATSTPPKEAESFTPLQAAATAVRYVPSIATGMTPAGRIPFVGRTLEAGVAGASEFIAQKIDEYDETGGVQWTDYATNMEDLEEAAKVAGGDLLLGPLLEGAGKRIINMPLNTFRKLYTPAARAITPEGKITQEVLESLGSTATASMRTAGEGGQAQFEDILRAGFFSASSWQNLDKMNQKLVLDALGTYQDKLAATLPPEEWGERLITMLLNTADEYKRGVPGGELGFIKGVRNTIYTAFRNLTDEAGDRWQKEGVDSMLEFLEANSKRPEYKELMGHIGYHLSETVKRLPDDVEKDILSRPPKLQKLMREQLAAQEPDLGTMAPADVELLRRILNKIPNDPQADESLKAAANKVLKDYVRPGLDDAIAGNPAARKALDFADGFYGDTADRLENDIMKQVYKNLKKAPDAVFQYFGKGGELNLGSIGPGAMGLSTLNALEAAFTTGGKYTTLTREMFEESVLKPMQTAYFRKGVTEGTLDGAKLLKLFQEDNAFADKLFGEAQAKAIRELATALRVTQNIPKSGSMIMQLTQGGAVVAGAGAMVGAMAGGNSTVTSGTAASAGLIFISPVMFTKLLTNPKALKTLTKAALDGPQSAAWFRALSTMAAINAGERAELARLTNISERAAAFYSTSSNPAEQPANLPTPMQPLNWPQNARP